MTIAELQKRVAELKGWSVNKTGTGYSAFRGGVMFTPIYAPTEERTWAEITEGASDTCSPLHSLSLLDEVEQAGCETDLWYFPKRIIREVPGYIARITTESYQCFTSVLCDTRDEAIYRAYIAYRESTKSGE